METTIDRIFKLIDYKKDSVYKLSKEISVSNGYFSKQRASGGSISSNIIEKIVNYYTDVNVNWLITGKGSMLRPPELMSEVEMLQHDKEVEEGKWHVSSAPPQPTIVDNEYLLRRFEELVVENAKLKEEINAIKSGKRHVSGVDTSPNIQRAVEAEMMSGFAAEKTEKYEKK